MKKRILILSVMLLSFAPPVFAVENNQDTATLTGVNCAAQVAKSDGSLNGQGTIVSHSDSGSTTRDGALE